MSNVQYLAGWITKDRQTVYLGNFRHPRDVIRVRVYTHEAWNSNGTDLIDIGYTGDTDAYANDVDVSSTGLNTVTLGSGIGFDSTTREIVITYTAGGTSPTTGKSLIVIEFVSLPNIP